VAPDGPPTTPAADSGVYVVTPTDSTCNATADAGSCSATSSPSVNCPSGHVCLLNGTCAWPSYTDNGDGTVTDNLTGLVWQQAVPPNPCGVDGSSLDGPGLCGQADANKYCQGLNLGGYATGWRLPTDQGNRESAGSAE
jgi:hypothetical protein